jgi:hypothetical protein
MVCNGSDSLEPCAPSKPAVAWVGIFIADGGESNAPDGTEPMPAQSVTWRTNSESAIIAKWTKAASASSESWPPFW